MGIGEAPSAMIYRLLALLEGRLSPTQMNVLKRMVEDMQPSLSFVLSPWQQRQVLRACEQCTTLADYMQFTRQWLGVGAVQLLEEIGAVLGYIRLEKPRRICEIGTEDGGTTFLLSQLLPSVELIIGIDLYVQNKPRLQYLRPKNQQLRLLDGPSHTGTMVRRVEKILGGTQLDVLFIDGDHRYEGVKKDFVMYRHLVREGGLILFHDIVQDHGVRYGKITSAFSGGVPTLWKELKQRYPFREFIQDPEQDGMGIGIIRYSSTVPLPDHFSDLS